MRLSLRPFRPQTIEEAETFFLGGPTDEPDYEGFAEAALSIEKNRQPTNLGHHPDCAPGRYPMDMGDFIHYSDDGEVVTKCRHCGYRLA